MGWGWKLSMHSLIKDSVLNFLKAPYRIPNFLPLPKLFLEFGRGGSGIFHRLKLWRTWASGQPIITHCRLKNCISVSIWLPSLQPTCYDPDLDPSPGNLVSLAEPSAYAHFAFREELAPSRGHPAQSVCPAPAQP